VIAAEPFESVQARVFAAGLVKAFPDFAVANLSHSSKE
jgi:hypothetical protein